MKIVLALLLAIAYAQTGSGRVLLADDTAAVPDAGADASPPAQDDAAADAAQTDAAAGDDAATEAAANPPSNDLETAAKKADDAADTLAANTGKEDAVFPAAGQGTPASQLNTGVDPTEPEEAADDAVNQDAEKTAQAAGYKENPKDKDDLKEMDVKIRKALKKREKYKELFEQSHTEYHNLLKQKKLAAGIMSKKAIEFMANLEKEQEAKKQTIKQELQICYDNLKKVKQTVKDHAEHLFTGIQMEPQDRDDDAEEGVSGLKVPELKLVGSSVNPTEKRGLFFYGTLATVLISGAGIWKYYNDRRKHRTYRAFDNGMLEF